LIPLFLASSSPRRRELLARLGIPFTVIAPRVDEAVHGDPPPHRLVQELARRKARAGAREVARGLVIGADTVVVRRGRVLGKPADAAGAAEMLRLLQGASHEVYTGLAVCERPAGREIATWEKTRVTFAPMTEEEIALYAASGEPLDKAGAYAVQGIGSLLITRIEGCYFNVVGLPLARLYRVLAELGVDLLALAAGNHSGRRREDGCGGSACGDRGLSCDH